MAKSNKQTFGEIKCPQCGRLIPVTEALKHQLTENVKAEIEGQVIEREREISKKEKEIINKEKQLVNQERTINQKVQNEVEKRIKIEQELIEKKAEKKAKESISTELKDLKEQLEENKEKLERAQENELSLRKRERELEQGKKSLELEVAKRIREEVLKSEQETTRRLAEEHRLKDQEKEKQINDMRKQIEDLKRKAEQGSQQLQGEVQELDLENLLKEYFQFDEILPVPKGIRGADVLQKVNTRKGTSCGVILWESKRTKSWNEGWITKLKDDQREAKADVAIIVSEILPKSIDNFGLYNGVWVTNRVSLFGSATAIRETLMQVSLVKNASESKDEKIEILFRYLTGSEFRQRVEAMVETFISMKQDLDKEKRTTMAKWSKQEKQIERVIAITAGMYGSLKELTGSSMQSIPALESGEELDEVNNQVEEDEVEEINNIKIDEEDILPEDIPF